jgi:NAD(P)-dependent dehydrogenase (short-subunit alcohol dehydrogenase family)
MTRGIFIVGNESSLLSAAGVEAGKRVKHYITARIPSILGETPSRPASAGNLEWNPASPVSTRTLVLTARNLLDHIDEALLICVPPAYRRPLEDMIPAEIDRLVDYNIKGWFFLARELASEFIRRGSGTLVLAVQDERAASREDGDLAGPAAAAAFRAFARSLLPASANAPYLTMGFSAPEPGSESAFAAYMFRIMEEGKRNSGKWHKFGKFSLFNR